MLNLKKKDDKGSEAKALAPDAVPHCSRLEISGPINTQVVYALTTSIERGIAVWNFHFQ